MIKSILFPTDFSENAKNTTKFAIEIAKLTGAKLNLLHVYEVPYSTMTANEQDIADHPLIEDDSREYSRKRLKNIIDENLLEKHPHRIYLREGSLIDAIEEVSKIENVDLIIIGQKGENKSNTLFGSNCLKIIINTPCPVFTVPSGVKYNHFNHITYLTDLSSEEYKQPEQLQQFSEIFDASVTLLHFSKEGLTTKDKNKKEHLLSSISDDDMNYYMIQNDNLISGIQGYIGNHKIDVLVMKIKSTSIFHRLFNDSLTEQVINYTRLPLLVIS